MLRNQHRSVDVDDCDYANVLREDWACLSLIAKIVTKISIMLCEISKYTF